MNGSRYVTLALTLLLLAPLARQVMADEGNNTQPTEDRRSRLLEVFGDEGIDADSDGTLSPSEIRAFFGESRADCATRGPGRRAAKGRAHRGPGEPGGKAHGMMRPPRRGAHGVGPLLRHLEHIDGQQPPNEMLLERHPEIDADGDGAITEAERSTFAEEARAHLLERLLMVAPQADANDDGAIDDEELGALQAEHAEKVRARHIERHPEADLDADGVLSEEEFEAFRQERETARRARAMERHPDLDVDGDGVLSDEEWQSVKGTRGERRHGGKPHGRGFRQREWH